ncbi:MAG: tRNA (adenosine(37)-N6)-threonylcarbamoyltransferase complex ATPase subunit type 1 TsaE [Rhizomicrobium sp.]
MTDGFRMTVALPDLAATATLGAAIADRLSVGDAVLLQGDLGSGKTTLARAILVALGVDETVPSPTFTLVQAYETSRFTVNHYDLYRLKRASEMDELGLEEALNDGAALIEWPERALERLPADALTVHLLADGERRATLAGPGRWRSLEAAYV